MASNNNKEHINTPTLGDSDMLMHAGPTNFALPETWLDFSSYRYSSPDNIWKIDLLFDKSAESPDPSILLKEKLETAQAIEDDFKLISEQQTTILGRAGYSVIYESRSAGQITRTRVLILMVTPTYSMTLIGYGPSKLWHQFEPVWDTFLSSLQLSQY